MKPYLRALPMIFLLLLCVPEFFWAQSKTPRPDDTSARAADGAGGTMVKKSPEMTDDDIVKLTVRKQNKPAGTLVAKSTAPEINLYVRENPEKANTELATLRQELKDRQQKLELLMKMFVTDEQAFIRNPSGQNPEEEAQRKRRYEQEELRQQTSEIGRVRVRIEALANAVEENARVTTR